MYTINAKYLFFNIINLLIEWERIGNPKILKTTATKEANACLKMSMLDFNITALVYLKDNYV